MFQSFQGIWDKDISAGEAVLLSILAIIIVFAVLVLVILIAEGINKGANKLEAKMDINPRPENELLNKDPDAIVASLVATIDFNKETGKNAKLISITKIEEE